MVALEDQKSWHEDDLFAIFNDVIKDAETTVITDMRYLNLFDIEGECSSGEIWKKLYKRLKENISVKHRKTIEFLLENGSLSTRILNAVGDDFSEENLRKIYNKLGTCLAENKLFKP